MNETINNKKGLNAFSLKIFALILMTFDHIHYMLGSVLPIPVWFNMIGRIVAPIFIFMVANGMYHTSNKVKYILRLYIASVAMSLCNNFVAPLFPHPTDVQLIANIFATLFLITLYIFIGGKVKEAFKSNKLTQAIPFILIGLVPVIVSFILMPLATLLPDGMLWVFAIVNSLVPSIMFVEGGISYVILGIGFYLCGSNKLKQTVFYLVYCVVIFVLNIGKGINLVALFSINYQWMMVFALPLILLYNGQRGLGMKYLFYFYYPIHLYLLLFIARAIA